MKSYLRESSKPRADRAVNKREQWLAADSTITETSREEPNQLLRADWETSDALPMRFSFLHPMRVRHLACKWQMRDCIA